ncbi:conserved hypothetical protein [Ricinus communis]|uniref:Uncharacterized protein n=1 Tax=Ricinus communis TaxID=3988 RepID=B9RKZ7_RICCO|nr:conserved hypothetical protein [Ricinus communis]
MLQGRIQSRQLVIKEEDVHNNPLPRHQQAYVRVINHSQPRGDMDLLGKPSSKFDYKVYYTMPAHMNIPLSGIKPTS